MAGKEHSIEVGERFLKAMRQIIADELAADTIEFAAKVGMYHQNIAGIKRKERYPTTDALVNLCNEFAINPAWILLGEGKMYRHQSQIDNTILKRLDKIEKQLKSTVK